MIKAMESEKIKLRRLSDEEVVITIFGDETTLSVDTLGELMKLTDTFWNANNLYEWTSEAIANRKRWEQEDGPQPQGRLAEFRTGPASGRRY